MEGEPEQPTTGPPRVSFTFQKTGSQKVKTTINADNAKEQTDFIFSLEGKEVQRFVCVCVYDCVKEV